MSHAGSSGHGPSGAGTQADAAALPSGFSSQDWAVLQAEDRQAARNIVCLMTGIFFMGLCGYLGIAIWVS